jgi:D-glycero-D-manno-heptose 1,7-bisphosphate phosphatase
MSRSCIFLDRDGVINRDFGYVGRWADFEFIVGAPEAMRTLTLAGHALVIITNQSGIARGYYSNDDYLRLTEQMLEALAGFGVDVLGVYHCPHHPSGSVSAFAVSCDCRKPKPGMILRAAAEHNLDLAASVLIGDKRSDMIAAAAAGVGRRYLLAATEPQNAGDVLIDGQYADLADCVRQHEAFAHLGTESIRR